MIKFEYQFEQHSPKVIVEMNPESTLSEVIEEFERFLRASGYSFKGELDIIEDENESNS